MTPGGVGLAAAAVVLSHRQLAARAFVHSWVVVLVVGADVDIGTGVLYHSRDWHLLRL